MIQKQFTYQYSQPSEYHFSLDSIELPLKVAQLLEERDLSQYRVLDLCAGCGVIGAEFHFYKPEIKELHFVEIQKEHYWGHTEKNMQQIKARFTESPTQFNWHWMNYESLLYPEFRNRFDLILANPPYFEPDQGKHSPSAMKNRSRFFMDSTFEKLIDVILHTLQPGAMAFVLHRPLTDHKKNLKKALQDRILSQAHVQVLDLIRGTEMLQIHKQNLFSSK